MQIEVVLANANSSLAQTVTQALADAGGDPAFHCDFSGLRRVGGPAAVRNPDVLLVAHNATRADTIELLSGMALQSPSTRSLVLYDACTNQQVIDWVRNGAAGCLALCVVPMLLAKAVRTVYRGGNWYGRSALLQALRSYVGAPAPVTVREEGQLTHREKEILHLIGEGLSNKEIGRRLNISDQTVKTHLHRVYAKLHQSGRYKAFLAQPRPISVRAAGEGR